MFKTGSKFLYGLAAFGWLAAIAYSMATGEQQLGMDSLLGPLTMGYKGYVGDHIGYTVLITLAVTSLCLALFTSALRDADPEDAAAAAGLEAVPEVPAPTTASYWPVIGAFSAAAVVIGLAVGSSMFVIGMVGLAIVTVEWAVRAWADRATGDPEVNRAIRSRFMSPVEIPVGAVLVIGLIVVAVSRMLLALPKIGGYFLFGAVPALVLVLGFFIVARPKLSQNFVASVLVIGGLAILGGGVAAAVAGEREHKSHDEKKGEEHGEGEEGLAPAGPDTLVIRAAD
jgi:hypothetical protein